MGYFVKWLRFFGRAGFDLLSYVDDHEPAHVHVFGDGQAKINMSRESGAPELLWVDGMKRGDVRRAMQIAAEKQDYLLKRWSDIHG